MAQCRPTTSRWGAIGGVILWFGWYGFNPGSTLSAMDWEGIGRVSANTTIAACAGGMMAVLVVYPMTKKWDLGISVNGFLGGLVAITCPCYWVSPFGCGLHRSGRRSRGGVRHPAARVPPHRRPDRRRAGARLRRDLGHAQSRVVRLRQVRRADSRRLRHLDRREGPLLRRRCRPAQVAVHRQHDVLHPRHRVLR